MKKQDPIHVKAPKARNLLAKAVRACGQFQAQTFKSKKAYQRKWTYEE